MSYLEKVYRDALIEIRTQSGRGNIHNLAARALSTSVITAPDGPTCCDGKCDKGRNCSVAREEFERQHEHRNLLKHRLRGTYSNAAIAALWNQHIRTIQWLTRRNK